MTAVTVESLSLSAAALAFVAGVVSFISPCVLPLLPVYLSYVSGVGVDRLESERRRVLVVALLFVAGFTTVFVTLGAAAGGAGDLLHDYRSELTIVAGAFLVVSGLVVAGVVRLPGLARAVAPRGAGLAGAFLTGAAVSIGWTPCVGYVLGSILMLAGSRQSAGQGALLLLVYSAGLGLPFVAAALAFDWVMRRAAAIKRHYRAVEVVAGVLLVAFGVLLMTGGFDQISRRLPALDVLGL